MNTLALFYHAQPLVWTAATFGIAYAYGKGDTDSMLDQWREMHRRMFHCEARPPDERGPHEPRC